jgi:hypothetical protein
MSPIWFRGEQAHNAGLMHECSECVGVACSTVTSLHYAGGRCAVALPPSSCGDARSGVGDRRGGWPDGVLSRADVVLASSIAETGWNVEHVDEES